jgi:DNA primase
MTDLREFADRLKLNLAVEDVVGQYVPLRRFGQSYKGLCPFHKEKTPSFTVNPAKGIFYCYGCKAGGDIISFIQRIESLDFIEALKLLSERAGIPFPDLRSTGTDTPNRDEKAELQDLASWAAFEYHTNLLRSKESPSSGLWAYLSQRNISPELVHRFSLGEAPNSWDWLLKKARDTGRPTEKLAKIGFLQQRGDNEGQYYDRFRHRLIFPIYDDRGRCVAVAGRIYSSQARENEPKYINSPESSLYSKGQILYAFHLARKDIMATGCAILCEGYMDVIRAHQYGFTTAVATCGTALTPLQAKALKRFAKRVEFAYDGDPAGQAAMLRSTALLLAENLEVTVLALPPQDDPDSFLQREGPDAFEQLRVRALPWLEYFLRAGLSRHGQGPDARAKTADELVPLLLAINHPIAREAAIQRAASLLGVSVQSMDELIGRQAKQRSYDTEDFEDPPHSFEDFQNGSQPPMAPPVHPVQLSRFQMACVRLLIESVKARRPLLLAFDQGKLHHGLPFERLVNFFLEHLENPTEDFPDYNRIDQWISPEDPLRSVLFAMAVDEEPLDDSERTLQLTLARLRREANLRSLREVTGAAHESLESFETPLSQTRTTDELLAKAQEAATDLAEQGRIIFSDPRNPSGSGE